MANGNQLPEGFVLDEPDTGLPPGFVLDQPTQETAAEAPGYLEQTLETAKGMALSPGQQIMQSPVANELISAINRGAVDLAEFLTTDQINAMLNVAGSEARVPTPSEDIPFIEAATKGGQMEPGLPQRMVRTGGEMIGPGVTVGSGMRSLAKALPAATSEQILAGSLPARAEALTRGAVRQMGTGTAAGDIALSGMAGAGAEAGREVGGEPGALVGAILAPTAAVTGKGALKGLVNMGRKGIEALTRSVSDMSDEGASRLLAEAMVRENMNPDDVIRQLDALGPDAVPADVGNTFRRLLRMSANMVPRIEGQAGQAIRTRQAGQGSRLLSAVDDATGTSALTLDDEITRLDTVLKPQIRQLYKETGEQGMQLSPKLSKLLTGKSSLGKAAKKAQQVLADKRAAGDQISNIDVVDATKQTLDDQIGKAIRQGENNKARDLIRLKNIMVSEADQAIPTYKEARNLYAGKRALENAGEAGQLFLKMKPRDMQALTKTYGESEKRLFKLGAKQAIIDKLDDIQTSADAVKRLFGKSGDVKKLRYLFDDKEAFDRFQKTLRNEADFILTRNAAQGNSTTFRQAVDAADATKAVQDIAETYASPTGALRLIDKISRGLLMKKGSDAQVEALEKVGDILLSKGMDPTRLQALLRRGSAKQIEAITRKALQKELKAPRIAPVATAAAIESEKEE